jgi:Ca-activated chloride channel homolog
VLDDMKLRRVPIALTSGWGALQERTLAAQAPASIAYHSLASPAIAFSRVITDRSRDDAPGDARFSAPLRAEARSVSSLQDRVSAFTRTSDSRRRPEVQTDAESRLHALVRLQQADGSWHLTKELAAIIGHDFDDIEAAIPGAVPSDEIVRRAWATALAVAWLHEHAHDEFDQWRLIATKAQRWLAQVTVVRPDGEPWLDAAARFVRCG